MQEPNEHKIDAVDVYFENLFTEHLDFSSKIEEVKVIQKGIEQIVESIIEMIDVNLERRKTELSTEFMGKYKENQLNRTGNCSGNNIINAGSFYEETKNCFPDEFDFIYVLDTFEVSENENTDMIWRENYNLLSSFQEDIKTVFATPSTKAPLTYVANCEQEIKFLFYDRSEGPASKLKFVYGNGKTQIKYIYVDIVPAFKIVDPYLSKRIHDVCDLEDFTNCVIDTGSYLITDEVSFTQTEVDFMRKTLSKEHLNAYRILKYLFNGNRNGEILRTDITSKCLPSYFIKVAMINHHRTCKDSEVKSECVIDVLEDVVEFCKKYKETNRNQSIRKLNGGQFNFRQDIIEKTLFYLEDMLSKLDLMREENINFRLKPLSTLILEDCETRTSTGRSRRFLNKTNRSSISSVKSNVVPTEAIASDVELVNNEENILLDVRTSEHTSDQETETEIKTERTPRENEDSVKQQTEKRVSFYEADKDVRTCDKETQTDSNTGSSPRDIEDHFQHQTKMDVSNDDNEYSDEIHASSNQQSIYKSTTKQNDNISSMGIELSDISMKKCGCKCCACTIL